MLKKYSYVPIDDLEDIYELTYKYQMLKQEQERGDYGLPQVLPDSAYLEFEKIKDSLERELDSVQDEFINVYRDWIEWHSENIEWDEFTVQAWRDFLDGIYAQSSVSELTTFIGDKETTKDILINVLSGNTLVTAFGFDDILIDMEENNIEELDGISKEQIEQEKLTLEDINVLDEHYELLSDSSFIGAVVDVIENTEPLHIIAIIEELRDKKEKEFEYDLFYKHPVFSPIFNILTRLEDQWSTLNLDNKIILFQEALTTAHSNGSMADYLLDVASGKGPMILSELSSGPKVQEWNNDLSKLLGYDPGTRKEQEQWYAPAFKQLQAAINMLKVM